jgi:hypothetical protein
MVISSADRAGANDADLPGYSEEAPKLELRYKSRVHNVVPLGLKTEIPILIVLQASSLPLWASLDLAKVLSSSTSRVER